MREILCGLGIILIGLVMGDSVFRSDFTVLTLFFDGIGVLLILLGVVRMVRRNQRSQQ